MFFSEVTKVLKSIALVKYKMHIQGEKRDMTTGEDSHGA